MDQKKYKRGPFKKYFFKAYLGNKCEFKECQRYSHSLLNIKNKIFSEVT